MIRWVISFQTMIHNLKSYEKGNEKQHILCLNLQLVHMFEKPSTPTVDRPLETTTLPLDQRLTAISTTPRLLHRKLRQQETTKSSSQDAWLPRNYHQDARPDQEHFWRRHCYLLVEMLHLPKQYRGHR